jgi:hypothetical protein
MQAEEFQVAMQERNRSKVRRMTMCAHLWLCTPALIQV